MNNGYLKVAAAIPEVFAGGVFFNAQSIKKLIVDLNAQGVEIALFPEMCLYGAANSSVFAINSAVTECEKALLEIADFTKNRKVLCGIGLPIRVEDKILNCIAMVGMGKVWSIIYKNQNNQKMRFGEITLNDYMIPFSDTAIIRGVGMLPVNLAIIIGSTLYPTDNSANIILNPYAADLSFKDCHTDQIRILSSMPHRAIISVSGAIYNSPFPQKNAVIAECGEVLSTLNIQGYITADIDVERIIGIRTLSNLSATYDNTFMEIPIEENSPISVLRQYPRLPYTAMADFRCIYDKLIDALYSVLKNTKKRIVLEQKQHFWLLVSVIWDMCKKYYISPNEIAVLLFDETKSSNDILNTFGFYIETLPQENISDNLKNAVILDWAQKNNAVLLGSLNRTDYLMHNDKNNNGVSILINFNKTFLFALLESRRKYDQDWTDILSANQIDVKDILIDFFIFHYVDNGLSAEKVRIIAQKTFDDLNDSFIKEQWNHLIDRL